MLQTPKLVGWYPLNSDATDRSTTATNGTLVGSPSFAAGVIGNGIVLNGSSQTVTFGDINDMGTSTFSVFFRFKSGSTAALAIVTKNSAANTTGYDVLLGGGAAGRIFARICADASNIQSCYTNSAYNDNAFHSAVVTFSRGTANPLVYIEGVLAATTFAAQAGSVAGSIDNTYVQRIGTRDNAASYLWFDGSIQDVQLYKGIIISATDARRLHYGLHPMARS